MIHSTTKNQSAKTLCDWFAFIFNLIMYLSYIPAGQISFCREEASNALIIFWKSPDISTLEGVTMKI